MSADPIHRGLIKLEGLRLAVHNMSSFHFSKHPADDQIIADVKSLDRFEEEAFTELLDIVFAFLTSPKDGDRFMNQVTEFAGGHGVGVGALKNVMKSLLSFFRSSLKRNLTPAQIKEDLGNMGNEHFNIISL